MKDWKINIRPPYRYATGRSLEFRRAYFPSRDQLRLMLGGLVPETCTMKISNGLFPQKFSLLFHFCFYPRDIQQIRTNGCFAVPGAFRLSESTLRYTKITSHHQTNRKKFCFPWLRHFPAIEQMIKMLPLAQQLVASRKFLILRSE
jgi:hypothetical protein